MATETIKGGAVRSLKERGMARLTFDVPVKDANRLAELSDLTGYNKVTTFLRAIRVLFDLETAARAGATITITQKDGTKERLLLR